MNLAEWRALQQEGEAFTLPSGLEVRLKKVALIDLAQAGQIPSTLRAPVAEMIKRKPDQAVDLGDMEKFGQVLDVVCDFIGFLVEVAADPRLDGAEWKLEHLEGKLQLHVKDDCRQCQGDAAEVCVPRSHPEFCSDECALRWLDRKGSEIAKFEDLDVKIGEAVEKALEENKKDVEQEIKEAITEAAGDLVDSEDNAVLEIIRLHGRDSRIDCATAARKLEVLFRSGQLSL